VTRNGSEGSVAGVLAAAGAGTRFGGGTPKQFHVAGGAPLWLHGVRALLDCPGLERVVAVVPEGERERVEREVGEQASGRRVDVVEGGATRQESVYRGLLALRDPAPAWVVVHDAARPWASADLFRRVLEAARSHGAVVPGLPGTDTLVRVDGEGLLVEALPRRHCLRIQTPQVFRFASLLEAHEKGRGRDATDDGTLLWEVLGRPVRVIPGEESNRKITTPHDLESPG
jgi:2-C-methyl-D-erythritol 4-phosphate cytidylyltransferase